MAKVRINGDTSGYIELASPAAAGSNTLTLPSSNGSANQLLKNSGTAGTLAWSTLTEDSSGNLNIDSGTLYVDATNNRVGIGTTSPAGPLQVIGAFDQIRSGDGTAAAFLGASSGNTYTGSLTNHSFLFYTNSSERARIDTSGRVYIGTTSLANAGPLNVVRTSTAGRICNIFSTVSGDVGQPGIYIAKFDNNNTTSQVFVMFSINNDGNGSGQINANGASQAAFGSFSDARLKTNINNLDSQWNNFKKLRPVEFDYIESEGGGHQIGFIAQEVQEIFPDLISSREDGMLVLSGMGKNESRLIKVLQEAMERIEQLETLNASFEARLAALEVKP